MTPSSSSDQAGSRPTAIGSGRAGPIRSRLRRLLEDARDAGRMTSEHELTGALAEKVAAVVDVAARDGDAVRMVSAIRQLRDLIDTLPVRDTRPRAGVTDDDGADDGPAPAIRLLTDPPTMGDTADA